MEQVEFNSCKKKDIRITLKFPTVSDTKAESEFIERLKEIYIKSVKLSKIKDVGHE